MENFDNSEDKSNTVNLKDIDEKYKILDKFINEKVSKKNLEKIKKHYVDSLIDNEENKKKKDRFYRNKHFIFSPSRIKVFLAITIILTTFFTIFYKPLESFINIDLPFSEIDYSGVVVHFIDVGQGDAIAITLPDGKNLVIDSGDSGKDTNKKLINYLKNRAIEGNTIDYLILTHPDLDHYGGMISIFENFVVKNFYRPKQEYDENAENNLYSNMLIYAQNENDGNEYCNIFINTAGLNIVGENYSFEFLTPNKENYSSSNDYSPIILFSYNNKKIIFTGDAETENENEVVLMANEEEFYDKIKDVDILKVGHHGSNSSTSKEFLEVLTPKNVVISCGADNPYGHPTAKTLARILYYGKTPKDNVYRTDELGNIVANITTNGELEFFADKLNGKIYIHFVYVMILSEILVAFFVFINLNFYKSKK